MADQQGIVALVTGASRGAGRGIALELGSAGATVYVTGRSVEGGPTTDSVPGTIDQTARDVSARGGLGTINSLEAMPLALGHAQRLTKFGA